MASSKVESNNFHFTLTTTTTTTNNNNSFFSRWIASSRSSQRARSFQTYAYVGTDSSLIYRFALGPLASFLVRFCIPRWVAPNCITLIGLVIGLSSQIAILFTTCGNLSAVASEVAARDPSCAPPPFLFAYDAVALLAYQTLDNMDGKQARRTKTSSPLGLLLDHGCDALHASLGAIAASLVFQCTPWGMFAKFGATVLPFYMCTWEERHTGSFTLPIINGPTEGLLVLASLKALTAFVGPTWWTQPEPWLNNHEPRNVLVAISITSATITAIASVHRVYAEACKGSLATLVSRMADLIPMLVALAVPATYLSLLPADVQQGGVAHVPWAATTALAFAATGLCMCRLVSGLLLRHACADKPFAQTPVERAMEGGAMLSLASFVAIVLGASCIAGGDISLAWTMGATPALSILVQVFFGCCVVGYIAMVRGIITEACDVLGVKLLRIPYDAKQE